MTISLVIIKLKSWIQDKNRALKYRDGSPQVIWSPVRCRPSSSFAEEQEAAEEAAEAATEPSQSPVPEAATEPSQQTVKTDSKSGF
jgi:hypothetical protein